MTDEIYGILCVVSIEQDFILISSLSCINCLENKMKLRVYNIYTLSQPEFNELKSYNLHRYNVGCKCEKLILWNQWKEKYSVKRNNNNDIIYTPEKLTINPISDLHPS